MNEKYMNEKYMNENNLKINRLLLQYDYLELYLQEVNFKYKKYNTQFLNEYYEMNPMEKSPETSSETLNKPDEEQKNNIEKGVPVINIDEL